jgi:hypothetical protein
METPLSWGKPGDAVPAVDSRDLKTAWEMVQETGERVAISMRVFEAACSPGADVFAVWYRAIRVIGILSILPEQYSELLAPWRQGEQLDDAVFKAAAKIPLEWESMEPGVRSRSFDLEAFLERVRDEKQEETAA